MGDILSKLREHKGFMDVVRSFTGIFEKTDKKALEAAIKAGDFKAVCKVMHVTEDHLSELLRKGATKSGKIVRNNPEIAVEAIKQNGAHGQRP